MVKQSEPLYRTGPLKFSIAEMRISMGIGMFIGVCVGIFLAHHVIN